MKFRFPTFGSNEVASALCCLRAAAFRKGSTVFGLGGGAALATLLVVVFTKELGEGGPLSESALALAALPSLAALCLAVVLRSRALRRSRDRPYPRAARFLLVVEVLLLVGAACAALVVCVDLRAWGLRAGESFIAAGWAVGMAFMLIAVLRIRLYFGYGFGVSRDEQHAVVFATDARAVLVSNRV